MDGALVALRNAVAGRAQDETGQTVTMGGYSHRLVHPYGKFSEHILSLLDLPGNRALALIDERLEDDRNRLQEFLRDAAKSHPCVLGTGS